MSDCKHLGGGGSCDCWSFTHSSIVQKHLSCTRGKKVLPFWAWPKLCQFPMGSRSWSSPQDCVHIHNTDSLRTPSSPSSYQKKKNCLHLCLCVCTCVCTHVHMCDHSMHRETSGDTSDPGAPFLSYTWKLMDPIMISQCELWFSPSAQSFADAPVDTGRWKVHGLPSHRARFRPPWATQWRTISEWKSERR